MNQKKEFSLYLFISIVFFILVIITIIIGYVLYSYDLNNQEFFIIIGWLIISTIMIIVFIYNYDSNYSMTRSDINIFHNLNYYKNLKLDSYLTKHPILKKSIIGINRFLDVNSYNMSLYDMRFLGYLLPLIIIILIILYSTDQGYMTSSLDQDNLQNIKWKDNYNIIIFLFFILLNQFSFIILVTTFLVKDFYYYESMFYFTENIENKEIMKRIKLFMKGIDYYDLFLRKNISVKLANKEIIYSVLLTSIDCIENHICSIKNSFNKDKKLEPLKELHNIINDSSKNIVEQVSLWETFKDKIVVIIPLISLIITILGWPLK